MSTTFAVDDLDHILDDLTDSMAELAAASTGTTVPATPDPNEYVAAALAAADAAAATAAAEKEEDAKAQAAAASPAPASDAGASEAPPKEIVVVDYHAMARERQQKIENNIQEAMVRMQQASVKRLTISIYINDMKHSKMINISSEERSEANVLETLQRAHLALSNDWTIFEVYTAFGIGTPVVLPCFFC